MTYSERAKQVFAQEIEQLTQVASHIDSQFDCVVEKIASMRGQLVVMGIGKTGIIGHKIASSLASTGTRSIFVNATEAVHGDLGMVAPDDMVLLISNSGSTNEILAVLPPLRNMGCTLIAMTGDVDSPLAKACDLVISTHVEREACPLGLAPTTSTAAALLMGDALMVCLMEKRQFKAENFALYHPGGALGRQLLSHVANRMTTDVPHVSSQASFKDVVEVMTRGGLGMTMVFDGQQAVGIITDGDLRRAIQTHDDLNMTAAEVMSVGFKHIHKDALLTDALAILDKFNITTLAVTDTPDSHEVIGIISIHHIIDFN